MKAIEIWMEGYAATGESQRASKIGEYEAENFDEAVKMHIAAHPDCGIGVNERSRYISEEAYKNRRSNYNIWACSLFDNERGARKNFG